MCYRIVNILETILLAKISRSISIYWQGKSEEHAKAQGSQMVRGPKASQNKSESETKKMIDAQSIVKSDVRVYEAGYGRVSFTTMFGESEWNIFWGEPVVTPSTCLVRGYRDHELHCRSFCLDFLSGNFR